jgi:signal transduction histidine kinase
LDRPLDERARGIGLRGQILLALLSGLLLAVALVGIAVDRLISFALEREREKSAEIAARAAAAIVRRADAPSLVLDRAEDILLRPGGVVGIEVFGERGPIARRGVTAGVSANAPIDGGQVRVWVSSAPSAPRAGHATDGSETSVVGLVVLYASMTSIAILVLCYVMLTRLIVRPVEELTDAAARLARGRSDARARIHGAAEVQRLALAFNAMSDELRAERAALESRLRELETRTRELRAAQDSLVRSEKLASVGRLAAGVAHEIGNPIAAILGLLDIVRTSELEPAERDDLLQRIHAETERIHRTIRTLLDFARQGDDREPVDSRCDLSEVVDRAVHLVAPQKDLRRITIERRIPEGLPRVKGSADALAQVVLNLLLNAADAIAGEGTITISVEQDPASGVLALSVTDTGPGIAPEVLGRIFEPFVTTKPPGRGTGLGLAVCWTIVQRFGGTIHAENAPGGGARFVVKLPVAQAGGRSETETARLPNSSEAEGSA